MTMTWKKTTCVMCAVRCGLEVKVENNRIVKVRPDKDSPISEGYVCRKGMNIAYHEHNADRLLYPMKKAGGKFERISWDQAIGEIAEKLKKILQEHGPRSLASVGGGGEFNFYPTPVPGRLRSGSWVALPVLIRQPGVCRPVLGARADIRKPDAGAGT